MINMRYKKLTGMHSGHTYVVTAPASEIESPMHWTLQCETVKDEKLNVAENDQSDKTRWQAVD
jgi:hypothetical protein